MAETDTGNLNGKLAVVTGATGGIGLYTALGLASRGASLIITGRDDKRLANAVAWLKDRVPAVIVETEKADFASLAEVRAMALRILASHPKIAILVNNAGLFMGKRVLTVDGFEATLQINHLSPFLLTNMLLPAIEAGSGGAGDPSRIINVSSMASRFAKIDFDDLNLAKPGSFWNSYGQSKLANILFTKGLAARLDPKSIIAVALHPGFVASNFGNKGALSNLAWRLMRPFQISQAKGAENSLFAATTSDVAAIAGLYLVAKKPVRPNKQAADSGAVERLWRLSAEMTGISLEPNL
jgi:NAD(P)-dependent dehydrogenase (short-subunit alcohol dehydrogenase family)